jgi:hypothetical protein
MAAVAMVAAKVRKHFQFDISWSWMNILQQKYTETMTTMCM